MTTLNHKETCICPNCHEHEAIINDELNEENELHEGATAEEAIAYLKKRLERIRENDRLKTDEDFKTYVLQGLNHLLIRIAFAEIVIDKLREKVFAEEKEN